MERINSLERLNSLTRKQMIDYIIHLESLNSDWRTENFKYLNEKRKYNKLVSKIENILKENATD
jgi:hypothetical protein